MRLHRTALSTSLLALTVAATAVQANPRNYNEPTRGFFLEHGEVARNGQASVELHSSAGFNQDFGGGIRLGLAGAELLVNSGVNDYDQNEALVKFGLPPLSQNSNSSINWAALVGVSHMDVEDESNDKYKQTNLKAGLGLTIRADAGVFTIQPMLVYADGKVKTGSGTTKTIDDTFFELGLGGYIGLVDTQSGKFSIGVEAIITDQDKEFGGNDDKDNTLAFGLKWAYNERVNLDFVPILRSNSEWQSVPGLVRLNVAF